MREGLSQGEKRRLMWRAGFRLGALWWKMTDKQMRAALRRSSWRRTL